jgi:uncharacterized membrane protein SirB2
MAFCAEVVIRVKVYICLRLERNVWQLNFVKSRKMELIKYAPNVSQLTLLLIIGCILIRINVLI